MAATHESGVLNQIQVLLGGGTFTGVSDARLLERFVARRDDAAFAELVTRHGAMVRNTCRAVLKDPSAADDAFQATFVLLFRKAGSIRGTDSLGGWLHRVAYRAATEAGSAAARRREVEKKGGLRAVALPESDDRAALVHEEIERLAERLRLPVVLCDLEGLTRDQAAERLGWTEGTVRGRLAKGRAVLGQRLKRRGIGLAVPLLPGAHLPEGLAAAAAQAAADASPAVSALAAAVLRRGFVARLGMAAAAALGVVAVATPLVLGLPGSVPPEAPRVDSPPAPARAAAAGKDSGPTIPIDGRIVDLEGRPVVGATVRVKFVQRPPDNNLNAWIDEVKRVGKEPHALPHVFYQAQSRHTDSAVTDRDGRFRIDGLPRECVVTASIAGPGIETRDFYILTRRMPAIRAPKPDRPESPALIYYGAHIDHAAAPARPVVGTIRDADTGTPIGGVHLTGMPNIRNSLRSTPGIEATSDARGRYQVQGLPISGGFKLFTEAPAGQPYVNCGFVVPASPATPGPLTYDITLKRGVLVRGRLTDRSTGKPLQGTVEYYALSVNRWIDEYPNFKKESQPTRVRIDAADGRFTIPALPGRGLITGRAADEQFLHGVGVAAIKDAGFDRSMAAFPAYPFFCPVTDKHVVAEINPAPGTREVVLELQADPGRSVTGTIVDREGKPVVEGITIRSLDPFQSPPAPPQNSSTFAVMGLPHEPFRLDFFHQRRKLAGSLRVTGAETGPQRVSLQPWGTVVGRVVDVEGNPLVTIEIFSSVPERFDPERGALDQRVTVDAEGRFRIERLVPGLKYDAEGVSFKKASGAVLNGVQVGAGEVKDLGDITLPPWK